MNRREFTASLAALATAPLIPIPALAATSTPAVVPAGTYAWAQIIARAQNICSPELLARQLHLTPDVAQVLFNDMLRDGVLRAPGITGIARAAKPIDATGHAQSLTKRITSKLRDLAEAGTNREEPRDGMAPLVKTDDPSLGCDEPQIEDASHASPNKPFQESPQRG